MDYIDFFGSIASIICFGIVFWRLIKGKISFFNLYMLAMVLLQAILVGWWLWNGKHLIAVIAGIFFIFIILFWLVVHLNEKHTQIINKLIEKQSEIRKAQWEFTKETNLTFIEVFTNFMELNDLIVNQIDIIHSSIKNVIVDSTMVDTNVKQLEDALKEMKKTLKKIDKKKLTK